MSINITGGFMAKVTGLSGNEIFCLALKKYSPGELVVGNSVNSMGFLGSIGASFQNMCGGEVPQVTAAVHDGRAAAFDRMITEAKHHGASGVAGVTGELRAFNGNTEFLFVGSCIHSSIEGGRFFTSAGNAQELYCHMDAGYFPIQHVFGNVAYSVGVGGGLLGSLKTLGRGEIKEFSDVFNKTRHLALDRMLTQAKREDANAVVGIRTTILPWMGTHEMLMTGTATRSVVAPNGGTPVSSDLTGEELWAMAALGYAPIKMLMSTSIYSLGVVGGLLASFKSLTKGEISDLTELVHDAREVSIERIRSEAVELGAEDVVGVKTYISEIGGGLVEFMAIGTAVKKQEAAKVLTPSLPVQAIIQDKDTWIEGDTGIQLNRTELK
jgi:uncharacterized protein YbjQ (UPF0145 family)